MVFKKTIIITAFLSFVLASWGQEVDSIFFTNPSLEDFPIAGQPPWAWKACGAYNADTPDVQPGADSAIIFNVTTKAQHGYTYVGLVVRDNESYEGISQRLKIPLNPSMCYKGSVALARSNDYFSQSRVTEKDVYYNKPSVLRIWGGIGYCYKAELLWESPVVSNTEWKEYVIEFKPLRRLTHITIEAFYRTPTLVPYNGNVLIDNFSVLIGKDCDAPDEEELAVIENEEKIEHQKNSETPKPSPVEEPETMEIEEEVTDKIVESPPKQKIIKDLERDKIIVGQTIRIDKLYFDADKALINENSFDALDEVYEFLHEHKDVIVEIGGHSNTLPSEEYCNKLSTERAKSVAQYLNSRGISKDRLEFKGYGKRKPVTFGKTQEAQKKNQRVEIKILSFENG